MIHNYNEIIQHLDILTKKIEVVNSLADLLKKYPSMEPIIGDMLINAIKSMKESN